MTLNNVIIKSVYADPFPIMEEYSLKGIVFPKRKYIGKTNDMNVTFAVKNNAFN